MIAIQSNAVPDQPLVKAAPVPSVHKKQEQLIKRALHCLESRIKQTPYSANNSEQVRNYLRLQLATELNEVFAALFLNQVLQIVAFERLFQGTVNEAPVYPRVILQRVLLHNAAAVILVHNHPSQALEPTSADVALTQRLKKLLAEVDVRLVDHFIVSLAGTTSLHERGLLD